MTATADALRMANLSLQKGLVPHPPKSLPYRPLARTCRECGGLITNRYIRHSQSNHALRHPCLQRKRRAWLASPGGVAATHRRTVTQYRRDQRRTRDVASRNGYEWTGPEIEIACRKDLTAVQAALALGRSKAAVVYMRHLANVDPRKQFLLHGKSRKGGPPPKG